MRWLRLWFGFLAPVRPREYLHTGVALMFLKFAGDATLFSVFGSGPLTPMDYLSPIAGDLAVRWSQVDDVGQWLLLLWLLPFVWIGASMSFRRARDAGLWPGLAVLFFAPLVNYLLMLALAVAPSRPRQPAPGAVPATAKGSRAASLLGLALAAGIPLGLLALSVNGFERYGLGVFLGAPFATGVIVGYCHNLRQQRSVGETTIAAFVALFVVTMCLLLLGFEGMACILMAAPLFLPLAWLGAMFGRGLALSGADPASASAILLLPLGMIAADERPAVSPEYRVVSSVEIDAPPDAVWPHVIAFSDLPSPRHWLFALGIAHPVRARIDGSGPGAVRRCEFSTGPFVEPITHWEAPTRLAFAVTEHPPPMREFSPFGDVHPPHLDGWFRAVRGEFRLVSLPGGRTRLEGSTWYALDLMPALYWRVWADTLVHAIHGEVLAHIRSLSE